MKQLAIVKLGGAAITDKNQEFTMRPEIIRQAMEELTVWDGDLIIVHGAGSFAHNLAKDYVLRHGISEKISLHDQLIGISKIRTSLQTLHLKVLEEANQVGLNTFSIPVSAIIVSKGDFQFEKIMMDSIERTLDLGLIPVLYGDIVMDSLTKFRVMSGDRIIKLLCDQLNYDRITVYFGTDVDGLYDRDPALPDALRYGELEPEELDNAIKKAGESAGTDVTGGMKGKLLELKQIVELGIDVYILNLTDKNRLKDTLLGSTDINTHFKAKVLDS